MLPSTLFTMHDLLMKTKLIEQMKPVFAYLTIIIIAYYIDWVTCEMSIKKLYPAFFELLQFIQTRSEQTPNFVEYPRKLSAGDLLKFRYWKMFLKILNGENSGITQDSEFYKYRGDTETERRKNWKTESSIAENGTLLGSLTKFRTFLSKIDWVPL